MNRLVYRNGRPLCLEINQEKSLDEWIAKELSSHRNPIISQFLAKVKIQQYAYYLYMLLFFYNKYRFWRLEIKGWRRQKSQSQRFINIGR